MTFSLPLSPGRDTRAPPQATASSSSRNSCVVLSWAGMRLIQAGGYDPWVPTLLRRLVTHCLVQVGWLLQRSLQFRGAAVAMYRLAEGQPADSGDLPLTRMVAQATLNRGLALGELGMYEDEMGAYDQVIERFGHLRDQTLQSTVSWAMVNRGAVMITVGRNLEAVALYESVVSRLRRSPEAAEAHHAAVDNLAIARRRLLRKAERHARVTSGRRDLCTIWIVGVAAAVLGIASLVSFTAYRSLPLHSARWLAEPVLYLGHREHAVGLVPRILFLPTEIVVGTLLISRARRWSWWVGIATGVGLGGALANATEAALFGSVTDFVGIRAVGLLSVGDICLNAGFLLVATIWAAHPAAVGGIGRRYLLVVLGVLMASSVILGTRLRLGFWPGRAAC